MGLRNVITYITWLNTLTIDYIKRLSMYQVKLTVIKKYFKFWQVLCQLQANYDQLQRRYAQAENIIDKLR